ncbi:hypothetical protein O181_027945 [Austropuccinia psidii MF-1]|uniref:Uncharacterized protein n=1 Tax=Austropuccinia psidii MF-1 TaxID=1389203 RepID=A0A9Q3H3P6_9BASI|nr:hypothetical protein [Austropuccinia psidii MF-1]
MAIISEKELELRMSNSKRYKFHSEGSDRHEPVQGVLHSVQGQGLENVATNSPTSDELLARPENVSQRGGNSEILQWMEPTIIQTSNQKDKRLAQQKEGGKQGRSPVASTSKPQASQPPQKGKITGGNQIPELTLI